MCVGRQEEVCHYHPLIEIKLGRRYKAKRERGIFQDFLLDKMDGLQSWCGEAVREMDI